MHLIPVKVNTFWDNNHIQTVKVGVVLIQIEMKSSEHVAHTDFLRNNKNEFDIGMREDNYGSSWIVILMLTKTFAICLQKCMPDYTGGCHSLKMALNYERLVKI
jgi:hypothetical protein